ncbi:MAG: FRG domain-containing protein [Rhizobiales bacterium]|nr:FRG domain-containing protein [Hyphomicrobiales bacterium]
MLGQWIGTFSSDTEGNILVDIDDYGTYYGGYAVLRPVDPQLPIVYVGIRTPDKSDAATLNVTPMAFNRSYDPHPWSAVRQDFPGVSFPDSAEVNVRHERGSLAINWNTSLGVAGASLIGPSHASSPSTYVAMPEVTDWSSFSQYVRGLSPYDFMFRGQTNNTWRLRTSFHRTGRCDLIRYSTQDMPTVQKHLSARTRNFFFLAEPLQYGAFVSLIQHHGYPTPLLDWTHSPFVAAYFAYRAVSNKVAREASNNDKVRIFMFSKARWLNDQGQIIKLAPMYPHFSVLDALAIENPRMIPQQGISSITNVDDIERYIDHMERARGTTYLQVFDLPVIERPRVMRELAIMGVTAGSLFPGLDGACEELRERFFET